MSMSALARNDAGGIRERVRRLSRYWRFAAVAVGLLVFGWVLQREVAVDALAVREWLIAFGPAAPLAYIAIYAIQVIVAPLPGLPIGAAAGFVFGLVPGLLYGLVGLGIGIVVALSIGRVWGLRLLARLAGPELVARWEHMRLINSPVTWLAIFLGPSPDLVLLVAGMTRIPLPRLLVVALLGRSPAMIGATFLGAGAVDFGPWLVVGATVLGIVFAAGGLLIRRLVPESAASAPAPEAA
jgi:uncharacterized membrane protein YdjX (TVP38/TMEM64 family)